jgi:enoyl-CoA hydratase
VSVRIERSEGVFTIVLDRPDVKNAVDRATAEALSDAFRTFEADPDAHVAVLHGEHGTFCSGADLKAFARGAPNRLEADGDGPMGPSRMVLAKPLVASIAGYAVAGGLELALLADIRVAEESAKLGVLCRRWGVPLIDGGTVRLPRIVGLGRALDMILTGRLVGAEEALAFGLVSYVVADGTARAHAEELAARIAAFPRECMLNDRRSTYEQMDLGFSEAMENEFRHGVRSLAAGAREGAARFAAGAGRSGKTE